MFTYSADSAAGLVLNRVNRRTGFRVSLYRAEEAGLDPDGGPWVTVCEEHGTLCNHGTRHLAESHMAAVDWCEECQRKLEERREPERGRCEWCGIPTVGSDECNACYEEGELGRARAEAGAGQGS